jgi:23S rRNA (adenine-N6)-dimethyltransferase
MVEMAGLTASDTVIEIGAGTGTITKELLGKTKKVIAYELDPNLFKKLSERFQGEKALELKQEDFLTAQLPIGSYKVFSNIPFSITSSIIKKLTLENTPPEDIYLIIQREAAAKFAGKPLDIINSQFSVILYPWFEFKVVYEFKPTDFFPRPSVNVVLLEIRKREKPLVVDRNLYQDFVTSAFNQPKRSILPKNSKPGELNFEDWINFFKQFQKLPIEKQKIVDGAFTKQLKEQENLEKIHRTRVDENWRKY